MLGHPLRDHPRPGARAGCRGVGVPAGAVRLGDEAGHQLEPAPPPSELPPENPDEPEDELDDELEDDELDDESDGRVSCEV